MIRQTDWSGVTTRNIRSRKWALIAAALLAAAADIVALVVTAVEGAAVKFIIPAALLLAADAVFILLVCLSNYRFKYTAVQWKAYVIVVAVLTAVAAIVNFALGELAMTAAAAVILILSHAVAIVVVALAARHASRLKRSLGAPGMIVALAVLLAVTALSAAFTIGSGYFGQGETAELRAAVYESDGDGGYVVTGAAEGRGDTLVIPERINGAEVTAISASVLADSTVSAIVVEGEEFIPFEGLGSLDAAVSAVRLMAHKNVLDLYKNELYRADLQNKRGFSAIANVSVPTGLEENEVYITFSYDDEALELAGGEYLPTTVLDKGSRADISVIGAGIAYAERSDASSLDDLKYNYDNNGRYILSAADELSSPLSESVCVEVSFERVFRVRLGEDNDSVYEYKSGFGESVIDGYTFTTASAANELAATFREREGREGFDLVWDLGTRLGTSVTDISAALSTRYAESSVGTVTMSPVWTLHAPEVSLTPSEAGAAYTYGDKVEIASEVEPPFEGCDISYAWTNEEGETLGTAAVYADLRPLPADSGTYTLAVSVSADSTSLTSSARASLEVTVAKKELGTVWSVPGEGENVYKAADFVISVAADGADVVFDDGVTITSSLTSVRDAGKYTARATLDAESAEKYVFKAGAETTTFEIKPLEITAEWGEASFVYDGEQHAPSAMVAGLGEDVIGAEIAGAEKNAGSYTARLTLTGEKAANYTVANASHAFEITPRGVTLVWDETELVYDGTAQHPKVAGVTDAVPGEEDAVVGSVSYGGAEVNAGNGYTATATLPEGGNYRIEAGGTRTFGIERRPLTLAGKDVRKTYDGKAYAFSAADLTVTDGLVSRDSLAEVVTGVTPSGAGATAKVAGGPYEFTLTVVANGEKAGNYTVTDEVSGSLTIDRRGITLVWDETELVYDGTAQRPTVTGVTGAVSGEEDAVAGSVMYGGDADATDAGDYTVTASLPEESNYEITAGAEKSFTIERRALTFEVRDNIAKNYDGKAYEFTTADLVLISGEPAGGAQISDIVIGVTPSGAGATAIDAGSYTFKLTPVAAEAYAKNYSLVGDFNGTIRIDKLPVTMVWSADREFVYDGTAQRPEVTDIVGVLESEKDEVLASVIYGAGSDATHAGDYTVTATLPEDGNYEVTEGGGCEFTIVPRPVSVTWTGGTEFTEDGEPHAPVAECADAVAAVTTEYYERNGDGSRGRKLAGAPDEAGAYIAVAVIADADNFEISGELECAFDIAEAETGGGI